jgi:cytochrome c oxidase subunit I+III
VDATPEQVLRLPGPSYVPLLAAVTTGGFFVLGTFYLWTPALVSLLLALAVILYWLWTGTALIPEKPSKDVGLGLRLPLYRSGSGSVSWWAMFITMLALFTAFASLVFGYFFYWTIHVDFPPDPAGGPGVFWPSVAGAATLGAWASTMLAYRWNRQDRSGAFYAATGAAMLLAAAGALSLLAGPWQSDLEPASHVYPAIVWILSIWSTVHLALGGLMLAYCAARRLARRMTAAHDIDLANVALYWHFAAVTVAITVTVIAAFPLVAW